MARKKMTTPLPLREAAELAGVNYTTLYRWATEGRRGVKLRTQQTTTGLTTTTQALAEFRAEIARSSRKGDRCPSCGRPMP